MINNYKQFRSQYGSQYDCQDLDPGSSWSCHLGSTRKLRTWPLWVTISRWLHPICERFYEKMIWIDLIAFWYDGSPFTICCSAFPALVRPSKTLVHADSRIVFIRVLFFTCNFILAFLRAHAIGIGSMSETPSNEPRPFAFSAQQSHSGPRDFQVVRSGDTVLRCCMMLQWCFNWEYFYKQQNASESIGFYTSLHR